MVVFFSFLTKRAFLMCDLDIFFYCAETQQSTKHLAEIQKNTILVTFVYHKQQSIFHAEKFDLLWTCPFRYDHTSAVV